MIDLQITREVFLYFGRFRERRGEGDQTRVSALLRYAMRMMMMMGNESFYLDRNFDMSDDGLGDENWSRGRNNRY